MDIFEAIKVFLTQFCPDVSHVMFSFRQERMQYEGAIPAITYEFVDMANSTTHSRASGIRKIKLDINLWGDLNDIVPMRDGISAALK